MFPWKLKLLFTIISITMTNMVYGKTRWISGYCIDHILIKKDLMHSIKCKVLNELISDRQIIMVEFDGMGKSDEYEI